MRRYPTPSDISAMVALSDQKRRNYELVNPQFWRASKNANEHQTKWLASLLTREDFILLVAERQHTVVGFVIGQFLKAPEVYDPGGLTLQIDDFCIEKTESWFTTGKALIEALNSTAKTKGAVQVVVVCGHHDESKRVFLKSQYLKVVSEWYFGKI